MTENAVYDHNFNLKRNYSSYDLAKLVWQNETGQILNHQPKCPLIGTYHGKAIYLFEHKLQGVKCMNLPPCSVVYGFAISNMVMNFFQSQSIRFKQLPYDLESYKDCLKVISSKLS